MNIDNVIFKQVKHRMKILKCFLINIYESWDILIKVELVLISFMKENMGNM